VLPKKSVRLQERSLYPVTHELLEKGAHRCYFREESFNSEQRIGLTNYMNVSIFIFSGSGHHVRVCRRGFSFLRTEGGHCYLYTHEGEKKMGLDHTSANK
jgi:hypothetical protein